MTGSGVHPQEPIMQGSLRYGRHLGIRQGCETLVDPLAFRAFVGRFWQTKPGAHLP